MTPKQKTIVAISTIVILAGGAYLIYHYVHKPKPKDKVPDEPAKTPGSTSSSTPVTPPAAVSTSPLGFKAGDMLFSKGDITNVYSYPDGSAKYRVGFIMKGAKSQAKYLADSSVPGFIKANSVYFTPDGKQKKIADVYIRANEVTNIAP